MSIKYLITYNINNKKQELNVPSAEEFVYGLRLCADRLARPQQFFCHNRMIRFIILIELFVLSHIIYFLCFLLKTNNILI